MIFNYKQDLKKIKFIQQLNAKEFGLLEKIVDNHIGKHKIKLKETCLIRLFRFEIIRYFVNTNNIRNFFQAEIDNLLFNFDYLILQSFLLKEFFSN